MINIKGLPLKHEDECQNLFDPNRHFVGNYFVKPIYKYLPDTKGLDDEERLSYEFKNVKEGL